MAEPLAQKTFKICCDDRSPLLDQMMKSSGLDLATVTRLFHIGAVWKLDPKMNHKDRIRQSDFRFKGKLNVGLFLDTNLLHLELSEVPQIISRQSGWEVWWKPSGWVSEGSPYGDLYSMERFVSSGEKKAHAVNRLDREVEGLMILCFNGKVFHEIQSSWPRWKKTYQAEVLGHINSIEIKTPIDGKKASTTVKLIQQSEASSWVEVSIETGRFHQIRRHLEGVGHPILGDPRYGKGNKDPRGLQLRCVELSFEEYRFEIFSNRRLF